MSRSRERTLQRWRSAAPAICPSLLACDFGKLTAEIADAERCGTVAVHWDVMDGHFVPNFTYGPPVIASCRPTSTLIFDAHLMMSSPGQYLDEFLTAGCDSITIHLEAAPQPTELLQHIQAGGALAGLTINPPTPVESLQPFLDHVDLILIMSVMPGFGGQAFDPNALTKLRWVKEHARPGTLIQVDGGVNAKTIASVAQAGADLMVVGSAFYLAPDRPSAFRQLGQLARS